MVIYSSSAMLNDDDTWACTDSTDHSSSFGDQQATSVGMETNFENHDPTDPSFPARQGLYNPEEERDACGVGFIVHIKGKGNHKIVSDARGLLCNMTHRGATGADSRDGDGAGGMYGIPHKMFIRETPHCFLPRLPSNGTYATGNIFFSKTAYGEQRQKLEQIADELGMRVLGWREVPTDGSILGPSSKSREPKILQPFVVMKEHYGTGDHCEEGPFDVMKFNRQLFLLRKMCTTAIGLSKSFYICSLATTTIVYKGQLSPVQVYEYFHDLNHALFESHFALVHSRFSTNTFPSWSRAQPKRLAAHNGEINTVRGNKNWMRAREGVLKSEKFGDELEKLYPIIEEGGSDSAAFDNVLELFVVNGVLTLPEAVMLMVPEAWQNNDLMEADKKAFYNWAACLQEPWDGPALFTFSDGRYCGANLDRNGLRPCRYIVTNEDIMICASEVGAIYLDPATVIMKGRLKPGRMLLVDTKEGRIVDDKELKMTTAKKHPFAAWAEDQLLQLPEIMAKVARQHSLKVVLDETELANDPRLLAFGYSFEQLNLLMLPMVKDGKEALGSMGNDTALACVSTVPQMVYDYFRQLFAQVTNPPIDPIRESIVMSLQTFVGPEGNLLEIKNTQMHRLQLDSPVLTIEEMNAIKHMKTAHADWPAITLDITFSKGEGLPGFRNALNRVSQEALNAVDAGFKVIILSDRNVGPTRVPLSDMLALGGVQHFLISHKKRSKVALVVESGAARDVHSICCLVGYGADAVNPWLMLETIHKVEREGLAKEGQTANELIDNYRKAMDNGMLKVFSKMGISTLASYKGAQIFEALGLHHEVISQCFAGTASRVEGATFEILAMDAFATHERGYPSGRQTITVAGMPETGEYHWRDGGEAHINDPTGMANLQDAVRQKNQSAYDAYSRNAHEQIKRTTLRGLLDFAYEKATPIPIEQVEPWNEIVRRFATGAMSYGSISMESHATLAVAMNRLGGKSNTGEGGEDSERSNPIPGPGYNAPREPYSHAMDLKPVTDSRRSAIKQVASGRFGVTSNYLADADEIQIKMAQGAKPGEGGELPGHKVSISIARTRHSTPGVGLISPPPHHDIYSIEDLKQLIYDLKAANPRGRISVKLVSEVGVGVVASGVAKAKAEHILIAGHDGGTGASRWTGIKHAGLPWELGVSEAHQTLVLNNLRGRVTIQTDGNLKTGRDVALACLLGAEEWGFATAPLIALGCIMMRKCHLGTCPVGIATQTPELRAKFAGQPEHVVNFCFYVANELREIMAKLGLRSIEEMVGRSDLLKVDESLRTPKTAHLDLSPMLKPAFEMRPGAPTHRMKPQDHKMYKRLDNKFIDEAEPAIESGIPVSIDCEVTNTDRALGTTLSYRVSKKHGEAGLPRDTIHINMKGSAGQSLGAFLAPGITIELEGEANDGVGKGLSGGRLIIYPPHESPFKAEENIIIGNVALYGASSGHAYINGIAAERFAVRNSGCLAVVEGTGDHGLEYMTGGRVVVLGKTGRNFAAGMSGGIAYVLDLAHDFGSKVNHEMVELGKVTDPKEISELRELIEQHRHFTGSEVADRVLKTFNRMLSYFVRVMPLDYKRVLEEEAARAAEEKARQNAIDLVPSQAQVDISRSTSPVKHHEPSVGDVEDAMVDTETAVARGAKLDKVRGFMKYKRMGEAYRPARKRTKDWKEVSSRLKPQELQVQAARCMDCGVPFCQSNSGCPISNLIPSWNELVFRDDWHSAWLRLKATNNMSWATGRVCPAPCQSACVAGINGAPVEIKSIECAIIDRAYEEGWVQPEPPQNRTGKKIAVIGSGPAGLSCAEQLNKAGHLVTVYERSDAIGGLLYYGIPNMKLEKRFVDRHVQMLRDEGINFVTNANVGVNVDINQLKEENDAVVLAIGSTVGRDLRLPGRESEGIYQAMDFLTKNTSELTKNDQELKDSSRYIDAKGLDVIVIGGGDTGNDVLGTSVRQGARSIVNFELLPEPPATRAANNPWPTFARIKRTDYGHAEVIAHWGNDPREYCISTTDFVKDEETGKLKGVNTVKVEWTQKGGQWSMEKIPGSEKFFPAQLVLLALGFVSPDQSLLAQLKLKADPRSNIQTPEGSYASSVDGVWACGDARRGQSLVVWAINEGRQCAREIDLFLEHDTRLAATGGIIKRSWVPPPISTDGTASGSGSESGDAGSVDSGFDSTVASEVLV